ncbi:MAG: helix-turn-helix transcriptional regulator [Cyanobacteria bacterium P01_C01_bin.72]
MMARAKITNRELAEALNVHETSVSRMKTTDTMPRIDGNTLDNLCNCLLRIYQKKGVEGIVMPSDLFEFIPDVGKRI